MVHILPFELSLVENLPRHSRLCTFWETDTYTTDKERGLDNAFEKEAWLSHVLLEWGVCGQVLNVDDTLAGVCFYAPPSYSPRHRTMPSGPVSPDAVLLSHVYLTDEHRTMNNYVRLIAAAVSDLRDRGVQAIESYGRRGDVGAYPERPDWDENSIHKCIATQDVLSTSGFKEIVPDLRVSRWRMDIDKRHLWQQSVQAALDRRYIDRQLELLMYHEQRTTQPHAVPLRTHTDDTPTSESVPPHPHTE